MANSLELAITAIRSGRKEEGRQLLNLLIQQNPNDEMAWLWMSSVVNTDEQRARCLYHVLAINPGSTIARRGLEVLGIVVSDSRPVRVPRDSQPIPVQRTGKSMPELPSKPVLPAQRAERRPFRVDPRAITQELPFTPVKEPFAETVVVEPVSAGGQQQGLLRQLTERLESSAGLAAAPSEAAVDGDPAANRSPRHPSAFRPAAQATGEQQQNDSRPAPAAGSQASSPPDSGPVAPSGGLTEPPPPPSPGSIMDTRPSQPVAVSAQTNPTMGMPSSPGQPYQGQTPAEPAQPLPAQATVGMPTQYLQPQNPWHPMSSPHANPTAGMPPAAPQPGYGHGHPPHPSEPMPAVHSSATMGMPAYSSQPPYQHWPQNPAFYSNATTAMPTMPPAGAGAYQGASYYPQPADPASGPAYRPSGQSGMVDYRLAQAARSATGARRKKRGKEEDQDEEEINILAVIIFGSLSVTALGGLGMLILLMFTSG